MRNFSLTDSAETEALYFSSPGMSCNLVKKLRYCNVDIGRHQKRRSLYTFKKVLYDSWLDFSYFL